MNTVLLSRHRPRLWAQPVPAEPEAVILLFDHVPDGYRLACAWIRDEWDGATPLYRWHIPCSADRACMDLCDFERVHGAGAAAVQPPAKYTGCVENWPEEAIFQLQRIHVDEISLTQKEVEFKAWPSPLASLDPPDTVRYSKLFMCGHCSERALLYPDAFTGLTQPQLYMIRKAQGDTLTAHEVIQGAAAKFRLAPSLMATQLEWLTFGNAPWIRGFGASRGSLARAEYVQVSPYADELIAEPLVPPWLLNGTFPIAERALADRYRRILERGKTEAGVTWHDAYPECCAPDAPPGQAHVFAPQGSGGGWVALARPAIPSTHGEQGDNASAYLPYGVTMTEWTKANPNVGASWCAVNLHAEDIPPVPAPLRLTFAAPGHVLMAYRSLEAYAMDWYDRKIARKVRSDHMRQFQADRIACEYKFLHEIYLGGKFVKEIRQDGTIHYAKVYVEESLPERRRRMIDTYGKLHFDHLWELPLWKLGGNVMAEDDGKCPDAPSAQNRWLKAIEDEYSGGGVGA